MSILDESLKSQLKAYLAMIPEDIILEATLNDTPASDETRELLSEISSLSDKVSYSDAGSSEYRPSFSITNPKKNIKVRFAAIPLGHEFNSLVLAMLHVGGHQIKLDEKTIETIKGIKKKLDFTSYISLSCQNCPDVVQALNMMAVLNPNISSTIVDGAIFKEEVDRLNIMAVPNVRLNNEEFYQGRMSIDEIIGKIVEGSNQNVIDELNAKAAFDVLVIGGGPAGSAAAIYSARKGIRTGVVASVVGGQVQDTSSIENLISIKHTEGPKLANDLESHMKEYDIDIIKSQKVVEISDEGDLKKIVLENGASLKTKALIIATGARWRKMGVVGEEQYLKKGVAFCPHCDGPLFKGKDIAVVGGGNSGIEAAIDLAGLASHVTVIEFMEELKADKVLQDKLYSLPNVKVIKNAQVSEVFGDGDKLTALEYADRSTKEKQTLNISGVFVQIGLMPNSEWAKDFVDVNNRGEIIINEKCQTSRVGVFAAGDVSTVPYKQIVIAMGEGAKASLSAFDYLIRH